MKKQINNFMTSPFLMAIVAGTMAVPTAWAVDLTRGVNNQDIVVGTAIKLNARTAPKVIGSKGIVVGACYKAHKLEKCDLEIKDQRGRSYQLADGIYKSSQGIRIHIQKGGITRISANR